MKRAPSDAGFSLAALIVIVSVISILLAAAVPSYQMRVRRDQEAELIFRGEEYVRAIQKYQRRFNANPPSIDALLSTNGIRFLRREYKDPISGEAFRLISVNPDGSLVGANTVTVGSAQPIIGGRSEERRVGKEVKY